MKIQKFIDNTKMLRDIAYINENIQSASSEFFNAHSMGISNSLQSKTDPATSRNICRKLVVDKLASDNPSLTSKSLYVTFSGEIPEKNTLKKIFEFLPAKGYSHSYWQVGENGFPSFLIEYENQDLAEYAFTQMVDFEFRRTKIVVSRSIDFENLSTFEHGLIDNPEKQINNQSLFVYIKKTPTGMIALQIPRKAGDAQNGYFMFTNGEFISWNESYDSPTLVISAHKNGKFKIPQQDLEHFYSMLDSHAGSTYHSRHSFEGKGKSWRQLKIFIKEQNCYV
jgi:hypothetical protein